MSKKWILYIGGFDLPDKNAAAQRVMGNAKAFRILGYDTFFIGFSRDKDLCDVINEYEGFKYINFQYPKTVIEWYKYLTTIKQFNSLIKNAPDIIIAYNYPSIALNKLHKWTVTNKTPLIADCTEWYKPKGNYIFRLIKGIDTYYRMKIIHPRLSGLIAISKFLYSYYKDKMDNVILIPPLIDKEMGKWNLSNINYSHHDDTVNIIYAGSPGNGNKDRIDLIIESLSKIKDEGISNFNIKLVGITREQYINAFKLPIPQNLSNKIIFEGRLPHLNTLNEIKKAHFFLFIRDKNINTVAGFPTKFVESISCGTPVITNTTSNINDYIVKGATGILIDNSSIESLTKGLKEAINTSMEEIRKMKSYCYQSSPFHYKHFISKYELLFNNTSSHINQ